MAEDNVTFFPGYKPPEPPMPPPANDPPILDTPNQAPNPIVIDALEKALDLAKKGEIDTVAILSWNKETEAFYRWLVWPPNLVRTDNMAFHMIGGLSLLRRDLEQIAHNKYASIVELFLTGEQKK